MECLAQLEFEKKRVKTISYCFLGAIACVVVLMVLIIWLLDKYSSESYVPGAYAPWYDTASCAYPSTNIYRNMSREETSGIDLYSGRST